VIGERIWPQVARATEVATSLALKTDAIGEARTIVLADQPKAQHQISDVDRSHLFIVQHHWVYDFVTLGHDQCRATVFVRATEPACIKIGAVQMLVGQIAVLADLHRHAATRAKIAVPRNDPDEITLSLFLAHVLALNKSSEHDRRYAKRGPLRRF